jgi:hypothetical protein
MLLNSFNSKINLPSVVSKLGGNTSEFDFIRIPLFGWYARSKTSDFVGNIFDFFPIGDWRKLYGVVCRDFSDCFDFSLPYSEYAEKNLFKDQTKIMQYQSVWLLSAQEAQTSRARHYDKVLYFRDVLNELGMPELLNNKIGYLTERVLKAFPQLSLENRYRYKKTILIPSFCSPKHICSLEVTKLSDLHQREPVFVNCEYGWYGRHGSEIVRNVDELKIKTGNTWNYKNDYWNSSPVRISDMVGTEQLIKIWSEAKHSKFEVNLTELMLGKQGNDDLRNHVSMLNYNQVVALEKNSGQELMDDWMKSREQQFTVQGKTYVKRDKSYFLVKRNEEEQLTNFTLDIKEIRKKNEDVFIWCGMIYFEEHAVPFEMEDKYFVSCHLFAKGIRKMFLNLGIGIPFINEKYIRQLITMIQLTCHNVKIVADEQLKEIEVKEELPLSHKSSEIVG